ncbi:MAG: acetyl-CoA carboxylase carboxyltransferase subunit, partial [Acidimicrobiales bacterium]|nr:acetyl-CoA carboxylase carboxyltransferase subunit [Acidimicrobiales bacterium]
MTDHHGDWSPLVGDLRARRDAAGAMGGVERLEKQRAGGARLDARARVERLCDPGTFVELGRLAGGARAPADGLVGGHGLIDGRPVVVGAEDFTVLGGSIGPANHAKRERLARLAAQERAPLVMLLDGAGARAANALGRPSRAPTDLQALVALSGIVPSVAVVMGPSAGHGALTAPLADHVIMVEGAALFSAGPPLVAQATGEVVDKESLGGAAVQAASGVAHDVVDDDVTALERARRWLSYFPASAWDAPPAVDTGDDVGRRAVPEVESLIPPGQRTPYDIRRVVDVIFDRDSVLELQPRYGPSIVTALARLGGASVAVVANQPAVRAGVVDVAAASKAARFLDLTAAFHLPAVFLADNPGVLPGPASERAGVLRAAARMYAAQSRHPGPKLHVTLRKAYGFGSSLMAMNAFDGQTVTLALPGAQLGAMPAAGAADASGAADDE